jgi:hypothetical protein
MIIGAANTAAAAPERRRNCRLLNRRILFIAFFLIHKRASAKLVWVVDARAKS